MAETMTLLAFMQEMLTLFGKSSADVKFVGVKSLDGRGPTGLSRTTDIWEAFADIAQRINVKRFSTYFFRLPHDNEDRELSHLLRNLEIVGDGWWIRAMPGISPDLGFEYLEQPHKITSSPVRFRELFADAISDSEAWRYTTGGGR